MTECSIHVAERAGASPAVFDVSIADSRGTSRHTVRYDGWAEQRIAGIGCSAPAFVEAAFRFLIDREPKEAILPEFDLSLIARYFPEVDREIEGYLA